MLRSCQLFTNYPKALGDLLGESIALSDVTGRGTPLSATAVEDDLLGLFGFLKAELFAECWWAKVQRFGKDGKGDVDSRWNHALSGLIGLPDVNNKGILREVVSGTLLGIPCGVHTSVGF